MRVARGSGVAAKSTGTVKTVPCGFPDSSQYPGGCNGRHICRPYGLPVIIALALGFTYPRIPKRLTVAGEPFGWCKKIGKGEW